MTLATAPRIMGATPVVARKKPNSTQARACRNFRPAYRCSTQTVTPSTTTSDNVTAICRHLPSGSGRGSAVLADPARQGSRSAPRRGAGRMRVIPSTRRVRAALSVGGRPGAGRSGRGLGGRERGPQRDGQGERDEPSDASARTSGGTAGQADGPLVAAPPCCPCLALAAPARTGLGVGAARAGAVVIEQSGDARVLGWGVGVHAPRLRQEARTQ